MRNCAICKKTNGLFTIELETDAEEDRTSYLCGSCYEHIAAVANRAMKVQMDAMRAELDVMKNRINEAYPMAGLK